MGVLRHVVFPALRLVVWAVIAAALVWLAFGGGATDLRGSDAAEPSVELTPPETVVARGDVVNTVELEGTVQGDAAAEVRSTGAGEVARVRVDVGDEVEQGAPLVEVTVSEERPDRTETLDDGTTTTVPQAPTTRTEVVRAPADGTVSTLAVLEDQVVSVGDVVAAVSPGTLSVVAPLTQDQQLRLLEPPREAQVTVPGGSAPFACTDVRAGVPEGEDAASGGADAPAADPFADPFAGAGSTPTGAEVTCRVPDDAVAFPGLSATLELTAGSVQDVLVLPVTAVQGLVGTGAVWRVDPATGEAEETPVGLGLTDGTQVEITEGLEEGDPVLEFVPGSDELAEDPFAVESFG
ncbi:efflux RND transporter periplasmic adaptor subunit [uncultured Pseudokineococcus sp.]|uniref:efflux RND transporter periplasmic adaptor subunit n=1 Tax=uncultured Pseudokineococcus sp. TaxID=1642928 RepID=UPI00261E3842|nr:efflux RND transporter periplasmic adaptor subunit [uncultured Pseudokineococcus sp.]